MKLFHIFQFVHDQRIVLMKNPFLPIQTGQWGCQGREARSGSVCDSSLCTRCEGRERWLVWSCSPRELLAQLAFFLGVCHFFFAEPCTARRCLHLWPSWECVEVQCSWSEGEPAELSVVRDACAWLLARAVICTCLWPHVGPVGDSWVIQV